MDTEDEVLHKLKDALLERRAISPSKVFLNTAFADLHVDDLGKIDVVVACGNRDIPDNEVRTYVTVRDMRDALFTRQGKAQPV